MQFKRINENTIRCILTEEDMLEEGLRIEDFFTNKDKTRGFLEHIVKQAQEEVDYKTSGDTLSMQVMPLPHNGLAITFSEQEEPSIQNILGHLRSALEDFKDVDMEHLASGMTVDKEDYKEDKPVEKKDEKEKKKTKPTFLNVFSFSSFSMLEDFCSSIPEEYNIKSQLYRDEENTYYLILEKGRMSLKNMNIVAMKAKEYATFVSDQENYAAYCKEHFKCILKKGAVKQIRTIAL